MAITEVPTDKPPARGQLWRTVSAQDWAGKSDLLHMGRGVRYEPSRSTSPGAKSSMLRGICGKGISLASSAELGSPRKFSVRRVGNATDEAICAGAAGGRPPHPPRL